MKIPPAAADAFAAAFAAKPNPVVSPPPSDIRVRPPRPIVGETVRVRYRNWRGAIAVRTLAVSAVWYGGTKWHPGPQWLFTAHEAGTDKIRDFAVDGVLEWDVAPKPDKQDRFWTVWNPEHPTPPRVRYANKASAELAAKSLARRHGTQTENIYVMQMSSAWKKTGKGSPKARHY